MALARTPFHPSSNLRSRSHLVVWEDIYKRGDTEPSPVVLGEQATVEETQRFQ